MFWMIHLWNVDIGLFAKARRDGCVFCFDIVKPTGAASKLHCCTGIDSGIGGDEGVIGRCKNGSAAIRRKRCRARIVCINIVVGIPRFDRERIGNCGGDSGGDTGDLKTCNDIWINCDGGG